MVQTCSSNPYIKRWQPVPPARFAGVELSLDTALKHYRSGIYLLHNPLLEKSYIGTSKNLGSRFKVHFSYNDGNFGQYGFSSKLLQQGYLPSKIRSATRIFVMEYADDLNEPQRLSAEADWIELLQPNLNGAPGAHKSDLPWINDMERLVECAHYLQVLPTWRTHVLHQEFMPLRREMKRKIALLRRGRLLPMAAALPLSSHQQRGSQ